MPNLNKKVKVTLPKVKVLKHESHFSLRTLVLFGLIFAAIGGYVIYQTFAAGPLVASIEAEQMTLPSGGSVVSDSTASGGKAIKLLTNGTATGSVNLVSEVSSLSVSAKGTQCSGSPSMSMTVDNKTVLTNVTVGSTSWTPYGAVTNISPGAHNVSITFSNDYSKQKGNSKNSCARDLSVDVTYLYGNNVTPAPTISINANPSTVTAGQSSTLTWTTTNAITCTGSGSWSGNIDPNGSTSTGAVNTNSTYVLTCTGSAGSASASATVTVTAAGGGGTTSSTCVLNDNTACPASYFTGPLGINNPIPSKAGQFLLDQYGAVGCYWQTCGKPGTIKRQNDIGRHFDGIGMQKNYGYRADNCTLRAAGNPDQADMEQWIHDNGSFPIIRWNPDGTIGDINNGLYDQCFTNMANYWKTFNFTIMLSPLTEFDGHANKWQAPASAANGNINYCGAPFIAAWQRMVNTIHPIAPNVGFAWEPQEGETRSCIDISYPGDAYVDWAATDWYNFCKVGGTSYCTPLHPGWAEFGELFNYPAGSNYRSQHDAWGPHKPFVVLETGTGYDTSYPTKKGDWFRNVVATSKQMKYLRGIMWFDVDASSVEAPSEGMAHNFQVDYSTATPDVYAGYLQMAKDPWFAAK